MYHVVVVSYPITIAKREKRMSSPRRRISLATTATFVLLLSLLSNSNISYAQSHQRQRLLSNSKRARVDNNNSRDGTRNTSNLASSSPKLTREQHNTKKATTKQQLQFL